MGPAWLDEDPGAAWLERSGLRLARVDVAADACIAGCGLHALGWVAISQRHLGRRVIKLPPEPLAHLRQAHPAGEHESADQRDSFHPA